MIEFIATIECFFSSVSLHKNDLQIVWARVYFSFHFSICNSKVLFIFSAPVNSRHTHKLICKSWCLLRGTKGKIILSLPPPFVLAHTLSLTMIMNQTKNHSPRINDGNTCESFIYSSSFFFSILLRFIIHSLKRTAFAIDMLNQFWILCVYLFSLLYFFVSVFIGIRTRVVLLPMLFSNWLAIYWATVEPAVSSDSFFFEIEIQTIRGGV